MGGTVRFAVIGYGNIGQQHVASLCAGHVADAVVSAVVTRSPPPPGLPDGVAHFGTATDLLQANVCDAVIVATPTMSHLELGCQVLGAGVHLLMEKPLGLSVHEGEKLLQRQHPGQQFAVMLNQRTMPVFKTLQERLRDNSLGRLQRVSWTMTNWFRPEVYFTASDWRATWRGEGGGLLLNQCIHNLDILQWLTGMPDAVTGFCQFGRYHDIEVEDEASAILHYAGGTTGVFVGSTGEAPGVNRLDLVGDNGMLSFDGERILWHQNQPGTAEYSANTREMFGQPDTTVTDVTPAEKQAASPHAALLSNFVAAIQGDAELIAPAADGLHSLALANAILWSAWSGQQIRLPLDSAAYQHALEQRKEGSVLREKSTAEVSIDMSNSYR